MSKTNAKGVKRADGPLDGVDKATALLLAMGKPQADRIIKLFEDQDIRALARSAMLLPAVQLDRIEAIVDELHSQLDSGGSALQGSPQGAKALLTGVVAEEDINDLMGEVTGEPPKQIWPRLSKVPDAKLAAFISAEQPQVAAYIVANLEFEKASAVLQKLDIDVQADLSARVMGLKPIGAGAAIMIAERLTQELLGATEDAAQSNNHARLGAILNKLERNQVNSILERLDARNPDESRKLKKFIFNFEDIAMLSPEDRSLLFDEVPSERIVLALRESDSQIASAVLAALSPRSRRIVEAELSSNINPTRKSILDARQAIAATALTLAEKGQIKLGNDDDAGDDDIEE